MSLLKSKTTLQLLPLIALLLKATGCYQELLEAPLLGSILAAGIIIGLTYNVIFLLEKKKYNNSAR